MKNIFLISIFSLLFLSGCSFLGTKNISSTQKDSLDIIYTKQNQFDSLIDLPIVTMKQVFRKGQMEKGTGWIYTHDYPDLGIKIYTDDFYSPAFKTQMAPFIIRDGNILVDGLNTKQFIKVIPKNPKESMQDAFNKNLSFNFSGGCNLTLSNSKDIFTGKIETMEFYQVEGSGNCGVGIGGEHFYNLTLFYNTNKTDRYYIFGGYSACAPGGCTSFTKVELY